MHDFFFFFCSCVEILIGVRKGCNLLDLGPCLKVEGKAIKAVGNLIELPVTNNKHLNLCVPCHDHLAKVVDLL